MAQMRRSEDASDASSLPNTEEKDGDGETTGYLKFTCKHCKGTPADIEIKDGDFFAPEYKLKSRPKIGESPIAITPLDELPT